MCFQHDEQKMHREFHWGKLLTTTFRTHFDIKKKSHTSKWSKRKKSDNLHDDGIRFRTFTHQFVF